jgi:hypothetical protein
MDRGAYPATSSNQTPNTVLRILGDSLWVITSTDKRETTQTAS